MINAFKQDVSHTCVMQILPGWGPALTEKEASWEFLEKNLNARIGKVQWMRHFQTLGVHRVKNYVNYKTDTPDHKNL